MRRAALMVPVGLVGLALPVPQASAEGSGAALGGFVSRAVATPIRVEVHEPVIPIPADPQAELNIAYTKATASSGPSGKGRASWLWPGDPAGEGFKTFVAELGLPEELGENGYVVQVNSEYPGDNGSASDEQLPGTVMRTSADGESTVAKAGWSTTGDVDEGGEEEKETGPSEPGAPGLPGLPEAPGSGDVRADEEEPGPPGLGALSAVVSADGVSSVSRTTYGADSVTANAVTRIQGLALVGGVITADTVRVLSRTTSTLTGSTSVNDVTVEGLAINGVPFGIRKDGVVIGGEGRDIPGLPDQAGAALAELGVSFALPTATKTEEGGSGVQSVRGLQVDIDFEKLRSRFDSGPIDDAVSQLPDEMAELKKALGAVTQARPHIVVVLGDVTTEASTVAPIDFEPPAGTPTSEPPTGAPGGPAAPAGTVGGPTAGAPADLTVTDTGDISGAVQTTDATVQPMSSGLPPLGSIPGALLVGGLAIAGIVGWWVQKMGGLVLGGGSACAHGLASGVPDLRKA